eukprot:74028_1
MNILCIVLTLFWIFLLLSKNEVNRRLKNTCDCIYDSKLATHAILIINTKGQNMVNIPRINECMYGASNFDIEFNNNSNYQNVIEKCLFPEYKMYNMYAEEFKMADNWSYKNDFHDIPKIGYFCDDGHIITAYVVKQDSDKLLVYFEEDKNEHMEQVMWIQIPNWRIAPPPSGIYQCVCTHRHWKHQMASEKIVEVYRMDATHECYLQYKPKVISPKNVPCNANVDCSHLISLEILMQTYHEDTNTENIGIDTLDDFLHLINEHDSYFEAIYNRLGGFCDIKQCKIFCRNKRARFNDAELSKLYFDNDINEIDIRSIVAKQVLDKIHCYYQHSYDVAFRLRPTEASILESIPKNEDPNEYVKGCVVNEQILKMNELISKSNYYLDNSSKNGVYSFGVVFDYPYSTDLEKYEINKDAEQYTDETKEYHDSYCLESNFLFGPHKVEEWNKIYMGEVKHKYSTFKEELIQNAIGSISKQQFQIEFQKAEAHYNSKYCRQHIRNSSLFWPVKRKKNKYYYYRRRYLSISDILSVMIYTNFTGLQYEFSQTYRALNAGETIQQIKERHGHFYWLGKFMKECVNWFGKRLLHEDVTTLYHGIGKELQFAKIADKFRGVKIYGPISTTSSIAVAMNFTDNNQGLIAQFTTSLCWRSSGRYFPCSWISDYASEQEYLFIQNEHGFFRFENIISVKFGYEYGVMLKAMRLFHDLITIGTSKAYRVSQAAIKVPLDSSDDEDPSGEVVMWRGGYYYNGEEALRRRLQFQNFSPLIDKLIQHQLKTVDPQKYAKYSSFNQLDQYGAQLFHQFC